MKSLGFAVGGLMYFMNVCMVHAGTLDGAATADGENVAVGLAAEALMNNSTAVGQNSYATAMSSSAYGAISSATALNSTAVGTAALVEGENGTALGSVSQALEINATAIGSNAFVEAVNGLAVGESSTVLEEEGVALGKDALAEAKGAVALGTGSVASQADTVSVGNSEIAYTRRITNVAPAISTNDAINLGQLNDSLDNMRSETSAGIAGAAAITPVMPSAPGKTAIGIGGASYRGEQAVAVSFGYRLRDSRFNTQINGGIAYDSRNHTLGKVGVVWEY